MLRQLKIRLKKWQVQYFGSEEEKKKHAEEGGQPEQKAVVKEVVGDTAIV